MMRDFQSLIRVYFAAPLAKPLRSKDLAQALGIGKRDLKRFQNVVQELLTDGWLMLGKNKFIRAAPAADTIAGTIKRTGKGTGYFRPHDPTTLTPDESLYISPEDLKDAFSGDEVLVQLLMRRERGQRCGRVLEVISRGSKAFVGTYIEQRNRGFVRIDGNQFEGPVSVGDPGAKRALPDDRVVVEMLRFPSRNQAGEAVITKVLGPRGMPGVDLQTIIAEFDLPDEFPEAVLEEARLQAQQFDETQLQGRLDLTNELIITIDPLDARDFDDAISLTRESDGNWRLGVHIADVAYFVQPGTQLDREARNRGTSVYLPEKVLPMLPEVISNALASLQQGKVRLTKSAFVTFNPEGTPLHSEFVNSAIQVTQRFAYEQVMPLLANSEQQAPHDDASASSSCHSLLDVPCLEIAHASSLKVAPRVLELLQQMHTLAMILRKRRFHHGALDLNLPEIKIDMTRDGHVAGAHRVGHDESHQIIEEFMLAANIAVATKLADNGDPFLRRSHAAPDHRKLVVLGEFAESLGYNVRREPGRADLQKLLKEVQGTPHEYAISYAILRSMKQATYSPVDDIGHYALAEDNYSHFTSPIRRYPDLTVHRLLERIIFKHHTRSLAVAETDAEILETVAEVSYQPEESRSSECHALRTPEMQTNDSGSGTSVVHETETNRALRKKKKKSPLADSSPKAAGRRDHAIFAGPRSPGRTQRETQGNSSQQSLPPELVQLGLWCSMTERRAQDAERELIKLKLLTYLGERIGEELEATITGVEKFGLFCTGIAIPAEGLIHISTMGDDHYDYDDRSHTLIGRRNNQTFRLGDRLRVTVAKVNLAERKLEMRLVAGERRGVSESPRGRKAPRRESRNPPKRRHRR